RSDPPLGPSTRFSRRRSDSGIERRHVPVLVSGWTLARILRPGQAEGGGGLGLRLTGRAGGRGGVEGRLLEHGRDHPVFEGLCVAARARAGFRWDTYGG